MGCSSGLPCSEASWLARWTASCAFTVNLSQRMGMTITPVTFRSFFGCDAKQQRDRTKAMLLADSRGAPRVTHELVLLSPRFRRSPLAAIFSLRSRSFSRVLTFSVKLSDARRVRNLGLLISLLPGMA